METRLCLGSVFISHVFVQQIQCIGFCTKRFWPFLEEVWKLFVFFCKFNVVSENHSGKILDLRSWAAILDFKDGRRDRHISISANNSRIIRHYEENVCHYTYIYVITIKDDKQWPQQNYYHFIVSIFSIMNTPISNVKQTFEYLNEQIKGWSKGEKTPDVRSSK